MAWVALTFWMLLRGAAAVDVVGWFVPGQTAPGSPSPAQLDWDVRPTGGPTGNRGARGGSVLPGTRVPVPKCHTMCSWARALLHTATTACMIPRRPPVCQVYTTIVYGGPAVSPEGFASCSTSAVSCAAAEHPSRHVASSMMPGSAVHRDPHAGAPAQPHGTSRLVRLRRTPRATLHDTRHVARHRQASRCR